MSNLKSGLLRTGLSAMYYSGAHRLLAPYAQGCGLIFTLHQVTPEPDGDFAPNRILKVTPDFLDAVLRQVADAGLDVVSLDEAHERLLSGGGRRRFVCFTLDDGYRDNREHAYPIFRRHGVPFTIYVPSDYPEGRGELWWLALEQVIAGNDRIVVVLNGAPETLCLGTTDDKWAAYERIYWWLRQAGEDRQRAFMRDFCAAHGFDLSQPGRDLIMSWDELRELAADPLVTIGAHTVSHPALARLSAERARQEIAAGAAVLARELGAPPRHLSYPYGDPGSAGPREFEMARELGFKTAVTTRKGVLFPDHAAHLTALPRVSLNGDYQSLRFTRLYLSGAPFALWNGFRRVDAA